MEEKIFKPSKYNLDIFDYVKNGVGNMVVGASAGSGKTRTLLEVIKLLDKKSKILVSAFNTDIVNELKTRIIDKENITIRTVHSLGFLMLIKRFGELKMEQFKYRTYITKNVKKFGAKQYILSNKEKILDYIDNISKLVDFSRNYLVYRYDEIEKIAYSHNIDLLDNEIDAVLKVMEWGKKVEKTIDFTDMVWLPNVLNLPNYGFQYDYVLLDECQDLSNAQRELVFKFKKLGTRYFFFGDKNQCLYAFSSASPEAFDYLCNMPNTVFLPLSISYRCPKNIVKFAQNIVSTIEYASDAEEGEVNFKCNLNKVENGDMILCRTNAPLMLIYTNLITKGKKCYIRGKEIGTNLVQMIKKTKIEEISLNLEKDGVIPRLYKHLFENIEKLKRTKGFSEKQALSVDIIRNELDNIKTIEILAFDTLNAKNLIDKIETIFNDDKNINESISLSTVHKAKGLEADNVYIIPQNIFIDTKDMLDWELQQEENIKYVAYTRAKKTLNFIDIEPFLKEEQKNIPLNNIKSIINRIYLTNFGLLNDDVYKLIKNKKDAFKPSKIKPNVDRNETSKIGFNKEKNNIFNVREIKKKKL